MIERTFNINITSRKNCVTVKCAPRDKTICWTPCVIIHVGCSCAISISLERPEKRSFHPPQNFQLPNEIRRRKNSDYRANLRLHLDSELSHLTFIRTIKYLVSYQLWKSRVRIEWRASHATTREGFNESKAGGEKSRKKHPLLQDFRDESDRNSIREIIRLIIRFSNKLDVNILFINYLWALSFLWKSMILTQWI